MSQRSPMKRMEGSDYEDKCGQRADDVGWMSNREKRKVSPRKERIGVNRNTHHHKLLVGELLPTVHCCKCLAMASLHDLPAICLPE